ncbi:MAG: recombinase family protein, partial [Erysipelotrichaceae bacterium]|nr:recombinase family protein [Erysipelotrichaceae bacterium]
KVVIYARVSTEHEAQISALENQVQYYDELLKWHPDWELVERYIDEGLSGTSINKRQGFLRMMADASKGMDPYLAGKDIVIVDPPRKGLSKELIASLCSSDVKRIVYVSCNPATLARDLELLKEDFEIGTVYPVDMFPYTVHLECVTALQRKH